jgi:YD repeat-containing protein
MKSVFLFFCLLLINFITGIQAFGQKMQFPVSIPSPNAAMLGQFGNVPVSLYSGLPQIEVPIYNIEEGSINVPISLNYHASGVKPDLHPGWVGLNWNLSTGGAITRTVRDMPDDDNEAWGAPGVCGNGQVGYFFKRCLLNIDSWKNITYLSDTVCKSDYYVYDNEPDEFNFSFLGFSGKFYIDNNGGWKAQCDKKIKISLIPDANNPNVSASIAPPLQPVPCALNAWTSYPQGFSGFIITTEDGTKYTFGGNTSYVEYGINFFGQNKDYWIASTWNLAKIEDPFGRVVSFNYERGPFLNQMYVSMYTRNIKVAAANSYKYFLWFATGGIAGGNHFVSSCYQASSFIPPSGPFGGKLIYPLYLKEINTSFAKISFKTSLSNELRYDELMYQPYDNFLGLNSKDYLCYLYNNFCLNGGADATKFQRLQWKKLDSIIISNKDNNAIIKKYLLNYNNDPAKRLMLNSVQQLSPNPLTISHIPPYTFVYDTSKTLPTYFNNISINDHWGFFNGKNWTTALSDIGNFYSYKETDTSFLKAGTLNRITYPTGGVTDFDYESHFYSRELDFVRTDPLIDYGGVIKVAGGLRIKKISSYDPLRPAEKLNKEYYYYKNYSPATGLTGASSGILGGKSKYYWPDFKTKNYLTPGIVYSEEIFSSQSILPLSENGYGSHIGYSEVQEKLPDGSITNHRFTNFDNGHQDGAILNTLQITKSPYEPYPSKAFERGKLLEKKLYSTAGNLVDKTVYDYIAFAPDSVRAIKAMVYFTNNCNAAQYSYSEATAYTNYTYPFLLKSEKHTRYDVNGNNALNDSVIYQYNNDYLPVNMVSTNSKSHKIEVTNTYPSNFMATPVYAEMVTRNRVNNIIEKKTKNLTTGTEVSLTKTNYELQSNSTGSTVLVPSNLQTSILGNVLETEAEMKNYDVNNNILSYKGKNGVNTSFQWGYKNLYPEVKIINAENTYKPIYTPLVQNAQILLSGSSQGANYGFTQYYAGDISLNFSFTGTPSFSSIIKVLCTLSPGNSGQYLCIGTNSSCVYPLSGVFPNVPPGLYNLNVSVIENTSSPGTRINFNYNDRFFSPTGIKEFFYQGFEEIAGSATTTPYAGEKYYLGDYSVPYTKPNIKLYKVNYHYLETGTNIWRNITKDYTNNMLLSEGDAIDEVRVYPVNAFITTYTYQPLIGMTSETDPNGRTTYYEYDAFNRLSIVRDQDNNILKKFCYNYAGQPENCCTNFTPNWQNTTTPTRCKTNTQAQNTGYQEQEQRDMNICSPTYNQTQWVQVGSFIPPNWQNTATAIRCQQGTYGNTGYQEQEQNDMNICSPTLNQTRWVVSNQNCVVCPKPPGWLPTGNYRCIKDAGNNNTGYQEREEKDMETCSATYNQLHWEYNGYDNITCPVPCNNYTTCASFGEAYGCIYGLCEQGYRVNTSSQYNYWAGNYECIYHYEYSDGSWSQDYYEYNYYPCLPCNYFTCPYQGEGYACIYQLCEQGYRVTTYSFYDYWTRMYQCIYHYEYSDGSWSQDYYEYNYYYPCY